MELEVIYKIEKNKPIYKEVSEGRGSNVQYVGVKGTEETIGHKRLQSNETAVSMEQKRQKDKETAGIQVILT